MEAPDDFYVELPSNINTKLFPSNTHANYRVSLARPLVLSSDYEVALVETFFLRNWYNIMQGDGEIQVVHSAEKGNEFDKWNIQEGYYARADVLIQDINRLILEVVSSTTIERMRDKVRQAQGLEDESKKDVSGYVADIKAIKEDVDQMRKNEPKEPKLLVEYKNELQENITNLNDLEQKLGDMQEKLKDRAAERFRLEKELKADEDEYKSTEDKLKLMAHKRQLPYFQYLDKARKVNIYIPAGVQLTLAPALKRILGISRDALMINSGEHTMIVSANRPVDLSSDINSLCIYSNIVHPQYMGDTLVPLLRIVHIDDKDGTRVTKTYPQSFYRPVSRQYIDIIEIDIRDMYGRPIHFADGDVVVNKLHFRRRQK